MRTVFDWATVVLFIALAFGFFRKEDYSNIQIAKCVGAGVALAVANQLGNHGYDLAAWIIILAAVIFSATFVLARS